MALPAAPTDADRRRWARYLVEERAEAHAYEQLARRRDGEEREILEQLARAERRHEAHWLTLLGASPGDSLGRGCVRGCWGGWPDASE